MRYDDGLADYIETTGEGHTVGLLDVETGDVYGHRKVRGVGDAGYARACRVLRALWVRSAADPDSLGIPDKVPAWTGGDL